MKASDPQLREQFTKQTLEDVRLGIMGKSIQENRPLRTKRKGLGFRSTEVTALPIYLSILSNPHNH